MAQARIVNAALHIACRAHMNAPNARQCLRVTAVWACGRAQGALFLRVLRSRHSIARCCGPPEPTALQRLESMSS